MRVPNELNIVIAGVGGQGLLYLARLLGDVLLRAGIPVLISEVHGMAQRGGSVVVHLRAGRKVRAPLVPLRRGHILVGMELIEAARYLVYLARGGLALLNRKLLRPPAQEVKVSEDQLLQYIESEAGLTILLNASVAALKLGSPPYANVYMLGGLLELLKALSLLDEGEVSNAILLLPKADFEKQVKLFEGGRKEAREQLATREGALITPAHFIGAEGG